MSKKIKLQSTSTELTGGAGFTYEDRVVAYYLAALLREERAAGLDGVVKTVAVQQGGHGDPMDDIIVELDDGGSLRRLSLQVKRKVQITAAKTNKDFRDILSRAVATRVTEHFNTDFDAYGFVAEYVALGSLRTLNRLIDWAKSSPSSEDFTRRFVPGGSAAAAENSLRDKLAPLIDAQSPDGELGFYAQFVALNFNGLTNGGVMEIEVINRLQELIASNEDGQDLLLFDRLCRIARDASSSARKWTRPTLLADLRGNVRLKVSANYQRDIDLLQLFSVAGLAEVSEEIAGFRVVRSNLEKSIRDRLGECRLVNLSGLPGCGKSAMLKRIAIVDASNGPILFLKSDRLEGSNWLTFASALGLQHRVIEDILAEISITGTTTLFIDGIDRVNPAQKGVIIDILRAVEENEHLSNWKVLASSRDQGLEAYRAWFPASFYRGTGIGDVSIEAFSDAESKVLAKEKPNLSKLLFGPKGVREIARRPFFAAVLDRSFSDVSATPQTEVDLISAWWARAGYDVPEKTVPLRQRALLDLAEIGVRTLGKNVPARLLKDSTIAQVAGLKADLVIRDHDGGAYYSFTHDIFFEWVIFRQFIELGVDWTRGLIDAGEPPLLGRVVGLLAHRALASPGKWMAEYRNLETKPLRPQWRREWLTAPLFTPAFTQGIKEFQSLLFESDWVLLEKLLVWLQAQHTIPSPVILQIDTNVVAGVDPAQLADLHSWPSDIESWGRLLDWLLPIAPNLPIRLLPNILEIFSVWQNAFADYQNPHSADIIDACANWLIELEDIEYPEKFTFKHGRWDELSGEARSSLAIALRMTIVRAARSYPKPAIGLFDRAIMNERMRHKAYNSLVGFTAIMAEVAPEVVVALAKAELIEELPQDRLQREDREHREYTNMLKRLRAIPEKDLTEKQKSVLAHIHFPSGNDRINLDDIGIDQRHGYYFPTSPIHEPFASLFAKKPEAALELVRDLSNHATTGWHQTQLIHRNQLGTPISVKLDFPWGEQEFWGDWRVYNWFLGGHAPQPLECAFLSLGHWAFKQIEGGRPVDEIIRAVVEGNKCYAVIGLALVLALEAYDVSEATFPIVTCQRLWRHDIARVVHEPTRNIDFLGFGLLSSLTGEKAKAKEFFESRQGRKREIRELAMRFALAIDDDLRQRFKKALARFPNDLPYEVEEELLNADIKASKKEDADRWAGLGDIKNYRKHETGTEEIMVSYEPPNPMTPVQERRLEESTTALKEMNVIGWATESLKVNALGESLSLTNAVAFARDRDNDTILTERYDSGEHSAQTTISSVAAVTICFGSTSGADYDWAWGVMERVTVMREPKDTFRGSKIPWHPANHLIDALVHDRRSSSPRNDSVQRLFELSMHQMNDVAQLAFRGLFIDIDEHVRWVAAQLAMDLSLYYKIEIKEDGERDDTVNQDARRQSITRALKRLNQTTDTSLTSVPLAWVKITRRSIYRWAENESGWGDADPSFNAAFAADLFSLFPIEAWCESGLYKPMVATTLKELVAWTAERIMPPWSTDKNRSDTGDASLIEWNSVLGDLLARAAPFFDTEFVHKEFLKPFLSDDEEGLAVIAAFTDMTVLRQIFDAQEVPSNTIDLLNVCVERVIRDRTFDPNRYRTGQVHGFDLPKLILALFFVSIEDEAPGAVRFANGDWSQVNMVMPIVSPLVTTIGWSPDVMDKFLRLCERAGVAYPLDAFASQVNAVLGSLAIARGSWVGTMLPARIAAMVQRLADANFPLRAEQAQELLKVLDSLIDLGDRRSAALEQSEVFRGVQLP